MLAHPSGLTPLQQLLDGLADAFLALDRGGRVVGWNPAAEALFGTALPGRRLLDVYPELQGGGLERRLQAALDAPARQQLKLHFAPNGRWYTVQAFPYADGLGLTLRETTDEHRSDQRRAALQEVATRLVGALTEAEVAEVLVESGAAAVGAYGGVMVQRDGDTLRLLAAHGYAPEVMQAWHTFALDTPAPVARAAQSGRPLFMPVAEQRAQFPDLLPQPGTRAVAALPLCLHHRVIGALAFSFWAEHAFDTDERGFLLALADQAALALERVRLLEEADGHIARLEREQLRLGAVLDQLPVTVVLAEWPSGRAVAGNSAIERLMGRPFIPAADINQYSAYTGYHPDGRPYAPQEWPLARTIASGQPVEDEVIEMQRGDGTRTFLSFSSSLVRDLDGTPIYAVVVGQDVSERQRATRVLAAWSSELERQVQLRTHELEVLSREQEAFTHMVSHDLRTPLRHVRGFADLLLRGAGGLNERQQHQARTISEAAGRMGVMIDRLLEFARRANQPLQAQALDLRSLVEEVWAELAPDRADRHIQWVLGDLPGVQADRLLLRYALTNLLSNAIKFTRGRDPARIELSAGVVGPETVIRVSDNGAGFDPQYTDKLFGVFQRLHRDDQFEGIGVGLANVQRIAARHGGRVWAEGAPDQGASFYLALPDHP